LEGINNAVQSDESILDEVEEPYWGGGDEAASWDIEVEFIEEQRSKEMKHRSHRLLHMLAVSRPEDTIYVGISKKAKVKDIEDYLLPEIRKYLQPKTVRVRNDKWLYYLIVYDLKKMHDQKISYRDIALKLTDTYPLIKVVKLVKGEKKTVSEESSKYFTAKNCENFYKEAVVLINGDYKNYLYV
jgi:hypothetical protein